MNGMPRISYRCSAPGPADLPDRFRIFEPDLEARFVRRPNRFIIHADAGSGEFPAHCPNPGRMRELLLPGRIVILEKSDAPGRKTRWSLAAVRYGDAVIPLMPSRANILAGSLVLPALRPGFSAETERPLGSSRIDWR